MGWVFPMCAVYLSFTPLPDITTYELAYVCAHNGCDSKPLCFTQKQYDSLPETIKRHFAK
jgi:hypothetical protein